MACWACCRRWAGGTALASRPTWTLADTVSQGSRAKLWKTMVTPGFAPFSGVPRYRMVPWLEAVQMADRIIMLTPNAGQPHDPMTIDLPRPRDRRSSQFRALVDFLYGIMSGHPETDAAGAAMADPQAASPAELPLPHTSVGGLDGMLRILSAGGGRDHLPELAGRLSLEVDDLIPLTDAAQLLGFAEVDNADIKLTPIGQQWAQASPSADKKIFAEQARDRAPLVRTIVRALSEAPGGKLSKQFFLDLLEHDFTHEQARAQLDTAINWGRYGQLYSYHAYDGQLVLTAAAGSAVGQPPA
jgi:NitT/TauT family transport system ATP-binding protein